MMREMVGPQRRDGRGDVMGRSYNELLSNDVWSPKQITLVVGL